MSHHAGATAPVGEDLRHVALIGSPNSGKSTLFNALTGLRAKTGNYPGVTVARYQGVTRIGDERILVEDLPGSYSLDAISPDEEIVTRLLDPDDDHVPSPDAALVVLDVTTLRRSLRLLAQTMHTGLSLCAVLTFGDEMTTRCGTLDVEALGRALGIPVVAVAAGRSADVEALRHRLADLLADPHAWPRPPVPPPLQVREQQGWIESVLSAARYDVPQVDQRTRRLDAVLMHPVWGTLVFLGVMLTFFQTIFTVAAPVQDAVEQLFGWLGGLVATQVDTPWLASFLGQALIGGVGGVLVFLPQILLLFLLIAVMEGTGYLARAALLMDRVMARFGLEGRAFVALLSSVACAIPGIMATRTLPSARERIATMMGAPLMTCSARLPVYVLLIGLLIDPDDAVGPFGAQGLVMFGLYLIGAVSAVVYAWLTSMLTRSRMASPPFYMELPPYRVPRPRVVYAAMWESAASFLRKVTTVILGTTVLLWALLSLPMAGEADLTQAGVDPQDDVAVASYVVEQSYAADAGRFVQPVFEPLGFDWRINVGLLASLSAREVFVSTMGQVAAAENPEDPEAALRAMTVTEGPRAGEPLFSPPTVAALLMFFVYALQCMPTVAVMRRETGTWRWPLTAFVTMFALAWTMALLANRLVGALM